MVLMLHQKAKKKIKKNMNKEAQDALKLAKRCQQVAPCCQVEETMRRAGSLLLLLLLLSLSASTAEAHNKESSGDNAVPLTGRRWHLRGRRAMAARGHGAAGRDEAVGASNTGASQEADQASAEFVHDEGKRSKRPAARPMLQGASGHRHRHHGGDAAAMASDVLRMDYSVSVDVHSRRPINNDAPLDELMEKRP
ncbi:uncharacterized protein [Triticum aestivum]|nr:uncharacterized protein LOC123107191 isoform X2 [Triticum aestivum]